MEGTVTSWNGTTLVLNITSTNGSGTKAIWNFVAPAITTFTNNSATALFSFTEDTTHTTTFTGFYVVKGSGEGGVIDVTTASSGKYTIVHDVRFRSGSSATGLVQIYDNRALFYRVYADTTEAWYPHDGRCQLVDAKNQTDLTLGWNSANTMGSADTTGLNNIYMENIYWSGCVGATDFDDNSRAVIRYSVIDNSMITSHGSDTSTYGVQHVEYYNNVFVSDNTNPDAGIAMAGFIDSRGGTGILADNVIPQCYQYGFGDNTCVTIQLELQNLTRSSGFWSQWGVNTGYAAPNTKNGPGIQYPAPRQNGMGRATGTTSVTWDGNSNLNGNVDVYGAYLGDLCPWYQWGNSGAGSYTSPAIVDFSDPGSQFDAASDYIQVGRDWINSQHPTYTKYTYPHPLQGGSSPAVATTFSGATISGGSIR
jgi:hypothetical protein